MKGIKSLKSMNETRRRRKRGRDLANHVHQEFGDRSFKDELFAS